LAIDRMAPALDTHQREWFLVSGHDSLLNRPAFRA
jgi:hypothetical protein